MPRSLAAMLALTMLAAPPAAQTTDGIVQAALADGVLGEQTDGYVGVARPARPALRAKVWTINADRRRNYAKVARAQNVPAAAYAASIGCRNLTGLGTGRAYSIAPGAWAIKADAPRRCRSSAAPRHRDAGGMRARNARSWGWEALDAP